MLSLLLIAYGAWHAYQHLPLRDVDGILCDMRSTALGLEGRPDQLVQLRNGAVVPIMQAPGTRLQASDRLQMGAYLLLAEERFGQRPPHGLVELGDGRLKTVLNTPRLRADVLGMAIRIRELDLDTPCLCRVCSHRDGCSLHQQIPPQGWRPDQLALRPLPPRRG